MTATVRRVAALLFATSLAGCATPPPPPAAVTAYAGKDCSARPDLSKAVGLTPEKERAEYTVTTKVGAEAACLSRQNGATPYVLYALPSDIDDKTLTVGATREAVRTLAPEVLILDANGQTTRSFAPSDYFFRGALYSVQFRPKPGDAYVLVAADQAQVGKSFDNIQIGINTTTVSTGLVTATWNAGAETKSSVTFSYEGAIAVTVFDSDVKERR